MNTRQQTPWAVSLAALVLTLTAACGSETAVAPADIGGADHDTSDTSTDTWRDDNRTRLDFRDNGLG